MDQKGLLAYTYGSIYDKTYTFFFSEDAEMPVARISMVEFFSDDDADMFAKYVDENVTTFIPELMYFTMIRTGGTSLLVLAHFPDLETANKTLTARSKMMASSLIHTKDVVHLEGEICVHHVLK